jgi:hypothetical protein
MVSDNREPVLPSGRLCSMKRSAVCAVLGVSLAIAGCSAHKSATGSAASRSPQNVVQKEKVDAPTALPFSPVSTVVINLTQIERAARMTRCVNSARSAHAGRSGQCSFRGSEVDIATFSTSESESRWVARLHERGGRVFVLGSVWAVRLDDDAAAKALQSLVGGSLENIG